MSPGESHQGARAVTGERDARYWSKRLGLLIGLGLLVAAIAVVWSSRDQVAQALAEIREPSSLHVAILLLGVLANLVLSGLLFSLLMSRYGRVGVLEMQALIATATLLNYVPLRPGLFGRIAYHKSVNGIPARDAAKTVVQALLCTIAVAGYFIVALLVCRAMAWPLWISLAPPVPFVIFSGFRESGLYILAFGIRYVEVIVWAARYWAAFGLLGIDIGPETALALACISVIATMVPFLSNGLGLREWAVGLASPWLTSRVVAMQIGLTAELVNRAAELIVVAIAGLIGMAYLVRRRRRSSKPGASAGSP